MSEHAEVTRRDGDSPPYPTIEMVDVTLASLQDSARVVAEDVNWTVMPGDYWVVGGLHGVGKSDFIAAAGGVLLPASGTYRLFGKKIEHGFEQELVETRLRVGVVFDGGRLLHHLTIAENVALPMQYHLALSHQELTARVSELLDAVDLLNVANANPTSISRNRQQRVGLARAMALQPEVLLLDGPLTGLDPTDANWWIEMLDRLAAGHPVMGGRPATLVATAHDFIPWRGHARQFAALRQKHLRLLRHVSADTEEHLMREIVGKDLD
jgi:ABC-type transporter Mla maintaining outer membrane lipid asymmetry ATPase subunit MlaF